MSIFMQVHSTDSHDLRSQSSDRINRLYLTVRQTRVAYNKIREKRFKLSWSSR